MSSQASRPDREWSDRESRSLDDSSSTKHNSFPKCWRSKNPPAVAGFRMRDRVLALHLDRSLYFDDLNVGDEWESPSRTVTESDVVAFAGLSGDFNAIHVDHEAARQGAFGQPVAHGLLGLAMSSGLTSHSPRMATLAFLAIDRWVFQKPIAFGDTIRVFTRVESIQPKARGRRAEVIWLRRIVNQSGATVQEGVTRTLVKGRAADAAPSGSDREPQDA